MAQAVCIDEGTVREGLAYLGDVVSIHGDDVKLDGPGYADFKILQFPSLTEEDLDKLVRDATSEIRTYRKSGKIELETSDGVFEEIKKEAKYKTNFNDLSSTEILALSSKAITTEVAKATVVNKIKCCNINQFDTLKVVTADIKTIEAKS